MDNKLPLAEAVLLPNEGALKREMETIGRSLGSTVDWVDRIHAIIRLEGLILGGATQWPAFLELLRNLKDPLVAQVSTSQITLYTNFHSLDLRPSICCLQTSLSRDPGLGILSGYQV